MTLIVQEFKASHQLGTLYQYIEALSAVDITHVRPHLLRYNAPAGNVTLKVYDSTDRLVKASSAVAITDIFSNAYAHGYYPFEINMQLNAGVYKFLLEVDGYAFAANHYLGWCNDYDLRKYTKGYAEADVLKAPLNMEIWTL